MLALFIVKSNRTPNAVIDRPLGNVVRVRFKLKSMLSFYSLVLNFAYRAVEEDMNAKEKRGVFEHTP